MLNIVRSSDSPLEILQMLNGIAFLNTKYSRINTQNPLVYGLCLSSRIKYVENKTFHKHDLFQSSSEEREVPTCWAP
jgi:hypothetical protein